jgi:hypothetical protein
MGEGTYGEEERQGARWSRPSRRPLCGLLRTRSLSTTTHPQPHPERCEAASNLILRARRSLASRRMLQRALSATLRLNYKPAVSRAGS